MAASQPDPLVFPEALVEQATLCMNEIAVFLADPYQKPHVSAFLTALQQVTGAEAASAFTLSEDNPHVLVSVGAVGYRQTYRDHTYLLAQPALTTHVFRTRLAINMSRTELERQDSNVPFSGVCQNYIESGHFYNIMAIPVLYGYLPASAKCVGVLKLENQGQDPSVPFRADCFALARILANLFAIAREQWRVTRVWHEAEQARPNRGQKSHASYREALAGLVQKLLDAEAAAIYQVGVRGDGSRVLRPDARKGFRSDRALHREYDLATNPSQCSSILSATASRIICQKWETSEIASLSQDPFLRECLGGLPSKVLRNALIFSVRDDRQLLGAIVALNKTGDATAFDYLDVQACRAFVNRHVVGALDTPDKSARADRPSGTELLERKFGPHAPTKGTPLLKEVLRVEEFRTANDLTAEDCAIYLNLTRQNYLGKLKSAREMSLRPDSHLSE